MKSQIVSANCIGIQIDTSQIPDFRRRELAEETVRATKEFFALPGVEEEYQEWLKNRRAAKSAAERR